MPKYRQRKKTQQQRKNTNNSNKQRQGKQQQQQAQQSQEQEKQHEDEELENSEDQNVTESSITIGQDPEFGTHAEAGQAHTDLQRAEARSESPIISSCTEHECEKSEFSNDKLRDDDTNDIVDVANTISRSTTHTPDSCSEIENSQHFSDPSEVERRQSSPTTAEIKVISKTGLILSSVQSTGTPASGAVLQQQKPHDHPDQQHDEVGHEAREDREKTPTTQPAQRTQTPPTPTSPGAESSSSSSESDTLKEESPDKQFIDDSPSIGSNQNTSDDITNVSSEAINISSSSAGSSEERDSNLLICDNKSASSTPAVADGVPAIVAVQHHTEIKQITTAGVPGTSSLRIPIKLPVVQEVITTLYSYRVESPKPTTLKPVVKKSRSLDDDEFMIQEISDASSTSELTDNQPLVSEADSEADSESAEMLEMDDLGILSVQTLPLDSDEEAVKAQEYTSSVDKEDVTKPAQNQEARELKAQRARKRAAIETHFMPQFINPRYLDSIKEENSDTSDIDRKSERKRKPIEASPSTSLFDDLEDDVFIDSEAISKKANAVFPKSNLDFSQRKKHISNLRAPKTGIIREEPACIIVEAKIVESMEAVEESCSTWTTNNIPESDTAEVVYIESTSSSSSDVMETEDGGADIDDGAEELDVRIETPTIDVDSEIFPSSSSTSSAPPTQNDDGMLIEIKHQQRAERLIEADNASVAETASESAASKEIVEEPAASEVFVGESVATATKTLPPPVCCGDQSTSLGKNISEDDEGETISRPENISELSKSSFPSSSPLLTTATSEQNRQSSETAVNIEQKQSTVFAIINNSDQQNNIISDAIDINDTSFSSISNILSNSNDINSSDINIPSSNDNTNSSNSSEVIENLPDFRIGEPCSNNMFATLISPLISDQSSQKLDNLISADNGHTENVNISSSAIKELVRQDSGGSHCSGHSQSTILTQCTAINQTRSSPNNADLADFDVGPCVSGSSAEFNRQSPDIGEQPIQSLRQICLNSLSSMPYGKVVLEELASVAESLSDLTQKHQEAKAATFATTEMPYPVPDLPRIEDLVVPVNGYNNISNISNEAKKPMLEAVPPHPPPPRSSQIKIMSMPPQKLNSPPPPPVPAPPKMESWLGMPTEQDPNVLVCLSPSQRNYMQETKAGNEPSPDNLLDMHKKFVERRGYHEMTMDQVEAINRGKAQHKFHDPSTSTGVPSSLLRSQSKQSPPPPPPPPLPRSFSESAADGGFGDYIGSSTTNTSIGDQNNHRLLAIIRDSQQQSSVSENTQNKVDQVKKSQCSAVPKDRRSDQGSQTEPAFTSKSRPSAPQTTGPPPVDPFGAKSSTETTAPRNSKMPQVSFDKNNFFNFDRHNDEDFFKSGAKRFSNIESSTTTPSFCSQLRQTMPKRYSNIETSSYESKKRIENGNVVYDYCDSNKQKYSNADDDKKSDAHHTNGNSGLHQHQQEHKQQQQQQQPHSQQQQNERQKQFTRSNIMSDTNLDANGGARPTESSTDFTNFKNRFFSGDNKSNSQNEFTYDEFRERAKESARRARSEFFDRDNHLFKDFDDDVSKFFKDDAFAKRSTSGTEKKENRETTSSKTFTIPIKVEGGKERKDASTSNTSQYQQFEKSSMSKSVPNLDRSGSGKVHHIPINIESGYKKPKEPKTKEEPIYVNQQELFKRSFSNEPKPNETRQDQFNRSISTDQKMTEKRLSSQNLDEWMRYTDDLGASSDNITRPFQREVDICRGRRVNVRAPRLTASTNDLCNTNDPYAYHDPYSLESKRYQFSSSNSMIDRTPISPCIASKRSPQMTTGSHHGHQNQQFDYLKQKELELQAEFERLENDRRRLIEELEGRHGSNSLRKDVFHHQSCRLPTLSEEEAFRQQMQNEWLNKVAEREERRMQKIIKISKPGDDNSGPEVPNRAVRKSSSTADISDEFLRRVKERRSKLQMPSDSDWESGAESQPGPIRHESNPENVPRVKVFEGQSEKDFKNLPQHLREFAEYVTTTTSTETETKTDECKSSTNTMSTVQQASGTKKDGVWSPNSKTTETQKTSSTTRTSGGGGGSGPGTGTKAPPTPPPPPVWSPQPSPTPGRKEFRPVKFESPTPTRKYIIRQESEPALPPWSYIDSRPFPGYQSNSCSNLNSVGSTRPTLTKAHSSSTFQQQGKGASYIENERPKIPKDYTPAFVRPNEVIYSLKNEYLSEPESENEQPKKMAQLGRRKFDGIGPTTKDGMPLVLRSEVKENNQHKWYKRMYNTLHRAKDDDEYVTIRYKTYRGRYPYKTNGYMSEPEPNYDSDYATMKYKTLDRRRIPSTGSYPEERNYGTMPNPVKPGTGSYKNQPGRIENYTPGRSSVSEKEKKEWWDEVMDIFNGHLEQQKLSNNYTEGYLSRALKEQGYESDTNLVFRKKEESQFAPLSPVEQKQAYRTVQAGGEPPLQGFRKPAPEKPKESPRRYIESDVNIHYKSPIRYEFKDAIAEDELARRQAETMKKLYQEERRRKYLQELQDMNSRRHTDNFTPSQKSPISLNRYDDFGTDLSPKSPNITSGSVPSRTIARALYNFQGQTARELTFKKGDVIYIRRQIDKNWYEGEHNAMVGLLPANYVEIISKDGTRLPSRKASEGQARAKFNFSAQSAIELSLNKGELVTLTRRVDDNWFEGKIANRKGIFPVSYVEVLTDIGAEENFCQTTVKPVGAPASHSLITHPNTTPSLDTMRTNLNNEFNNLTNGHPTNGILRETKQVHKTEVLHVDTNTEPIPYRALYKYRPQNTDELELQEGDIVYVLEKCDDGWYVGTSSRTGYFGTFPGNYVERM